MMGRSALQRAKEDPASEERDPGSEDSADEPAAAVAPGVARLSAGLILDPQLWMPVASTPDSGAKPGAMVSPNDGSARNRDLPIPAARTPDIRGNSIISADFRIETADVSQTGDPNSGAKGGEARNPWVPLHNAEAEPVAPAAADAPALPVFPATLLSDGEVTLPPPGAMPLDAGSESATLLDVSGVDPARQNANLDLLVRAGDLGLADSSLDLRLQLRQRGGEVFLQISGSNSSLASDLQDHWPRLAEKLHADGLALEQFRMGPAVGQPRAADEAGAETPGDPQRHQRRENPSGQHQQPQHESPRQRHRFPGAANSDPEFVPFLIK